MSSKLWFITAVCLILCSSVAIGSSEPAERHPSVSFYTDPEVCRGWFCYEDHSPPTELQSKAETTPEMLRPAFSGEVDWEAVWSLHPDEMRTLINQALAYAQERPQDEERMLTYLKLQGVAMRRAKNFQEAWSAALLKYPVLDNTVKRAPTLAATSAEIVAEREERGQAIEDMRKDMGIIYFYSPTCRYCKQQHSILASFSEKWGWQNIKTINALEYPRVAQEYGVQSVPDIWVAGNVKGQTVQRRLKSGLVEFADLERGLLKAWALWNRNETYERPEMIHQLQTFNNFLQGNTPEVNPSEK